MDETLASRKLDRERKYNRLQEINEDKADKTSSDRFQDEANEDQPLLLQVSTSSGVLYEISGYS